LFKNLNTIVKDSIKTDNPEASKVFIASNYDLSIKSWRLPFKNPYSGKGFSLIYPQERSDAKLNLSNNFSNINVEIKYYFNLLSLAYEPILVSITDKHSKICKKFIIPFKDVSLLKNLFLTNNYYRTLFPPLVRESINFYYLWVGGNEGYLEQLNKGTIGYDENIMRYFVNNGKPKYYFNYGFHNGSHTSIRNLDDMNDFFDFPALSDACGSDRHKQLRMFDIVPYFVLGNKCACGRSMCSAQRVTYIFGKNKTKSIGLADEFVYPAGISPNGKYRINTSGVYEKTSGIFLIRFQNLSKYFGQSDSIKYDKIYWDCNSYFFGIGNNLFPLPLLEEVLK
ncbi:hypothetical protein OAN33_07365, partial [Flavobacteriales bacterium]|nr:hypothetical protein [Flavobacteriales bacterium]